MTSSEGPIEVGAVANFMIGRAKKGKDPLTLVRLQDLVYLGYGVHLALNDRRLFKEHIEAWPYGPVVPELYHEFKRFGAVRIRGWSTDFNYETRRVSFPAVDDDDLLALHSLNFTWSYYGNRSAMDLRRVTHRPGSPWDKVKSEERTMIPDRWIRKEFSDILDQVAEWILTRQADG